MKQLRAKPGKRFTSEEIQKPLYIVECNQNMGAVDKTDMQLSFTECVLKSKKWYKKFFHLLDLSTLNSCLVLRSDWETATVSCINDEIRQLLEKHFSSRKCPQGGRPSNGDAPLRPKERHLPSLMPAR